MTGTLRRVLVRPPATDFSRWREYRWLAEPDAKRIADEHEGFRKTLEEAGAEVVVAAKAADQNPDAVYVFDPAFVTDAGAILLRPGKEARRSEVEALRADFEAAGVPIAAELTAPALAEGGDAFWLDERTLVVGLGYRTNEAGAAQLGAALPGVEVITVDLPHHLGREHCMHMLTLISPLDADLALVYLPLLPVRLVELLEERGIDLVEVPDEEFKSMACNVLALGPRKALALEGNPETRRRMEAAGVDVRVYTGRGALSQGRRRAYVPDPSPVTRLSTRSTASAGVSARSIPSSSQPGSRTTTGRPSRIANPISARVPQLPPTAITASPEPATARLRACPMPVTTAWSIHSFASARLLPGRMPIVVPPAFFAPRAAAAITSPRPPVTTVQPRSASRRPTSSARASCSEPLPITETWITGRW